MAEQCIDEFVTVEPAQVVDALADADVSHRNAELVADSDDYAAFGSTVQLGDGQ